MPRKSVVALDPGRFDLVSFADILPSREPIVGEAVGSYVMFHAGISQSLAPATPYECVMVENLIAIEWQLLQHRQIRDAGLRETIRKEICKVFLSTLEYRHQCAIDEDWERHCACGGTEEDWDAEEDFDEDAARDAGQDLAARATSLIPTVQASAYAEIEALGVTPFELMRLAYSKDSYTLLDHDAKIRELEQRRHQVMRDFDMLQGARRITAEVMDAEVVEAEGSQSAKTTTMKTKT